MRLIAEIGTNFDPDDPLEALKTAQENGADIVKIQLFRAKTLYAVPELQERVRLFEFKPEWLKDWDGCPVWATVFDIELAEQALPYVKGLKIASGDLVYQKIVESTARLASETNIPLALSTGAATEAEIKQALDWVQPFPVKELILFQCVSVYPAEPKDYNLRAILPFRKYVDTIGLSDHTTSYITAMLARALGYEVFERHFKFQETWQKPVTPPDWGAWAFTPSAFWEYRFMIEWTDEILGTGMKRVMEDESDERVWARRGSDGRRPIDVARD